MAALATRTVTQTPLRPLTTIERYFSLHFSLGFARQSGEATSTEPPRLGEDVCVARHHNGICVLCLSPRHPILTDDMDLDRVEFHAEFRSVSGKRKKGGTFMQEKTKICSLLCKNGRKYLVQCPIRGTLLELNKSLEDDPGLLLRKPTGEGFLAVILPRQVERESAAKNLMEKKEYDQKFQ